MGDKSPKDRNKKKKQHERELAEINKVKQDRVPKANQGQNPGAVPGTDQRKAG